ncbi:MAG: beta-lactamase family protein [Gemmatimonadetes bacterium]|nr:beta-lactamase family protein [Gemmatimonadota bacterium]MBT5450458.1 beta-lactamase family protein [Gemmatimonadota bacterium]MBT6902814.1 beta-lactamase family protein [Gemmatimonadota bacterium]MBT7551949.1 beta-lactamase family protein [Gemmatimonadota bacterium]
MDETLKDTIPQIEAMARDKLSHYRLPGLALGIVRGDELAWFGGFGRANLDRDATPTVDSLARVASVSKTFTATAIVQLRDEGKLGLDDPLVQHIPEFAAVQVRAGTLEAVTLRRMLTHRAGLATESPVDGWGALRFPTREEILAALPQTEVVIPQDSAWKYSNLAYGLLGEVIQRVSRQPYETYIQEYLFDPLAIASATFDLDDKHRSQLMTGYDPTPYQDRPEPAAYAHLRGIAAAGQLHASVADLARWVSFQFRTEDAPRAGAQVLAGASLSEMHRPQYIENDWSAGQCLGWRATRVGERVHHNHGGGIHGFGTQVFFNKPTRTGAILLINMWPPHGGLDLAQEILELILAADEARGSKRTTTDFSPVPETYRPLLGTYVAAPGIWVNIEWRAGALRLAVPQGRDSSLHAPAELVPTEDELEFRVRGARGAGEMAVFKIEEGVASYALGAFEFRQLKI